MILIDETKLTNGTIGMIGYDLGIEGYNVNDWFKNIKSFDEYTDKVIEILRVQER